MLIALLSQSINQSKQIYIVPLVVCELEARYGDGYTLCSW